MPINLSNSVLAGLEFRDKSASYSRRVFQWTGPSSYVTGGESINTTNVFGLGSIAVVHAGAAYNDTDLRLVRYNPTTGKLQWFDLAGAEVANGTDLSAYSFRGEALGK